MKPSQTFVVHNSGNTLRRRWSLRGQVQGVGFRPFVYRIAQRSHLAGFVRNDSSAVTIEAQGPASSLDAFDHALRTELPPLAVIDHIESTTLPLADFPAEFRIENSLSDARHQPNVTVDTAICPDCLHEMLDPADRRFGYALINCTNCGPRFSILRQVPYDRPNTTMSSFRLCEKCHQEYTDPLDRRFHAQPIACHVCGPHLSLVNPDGVCLSDDPALAAAQMLRDGKILAIKGLGGFHLAVRADLEPAVARLRQLKKRDAKPFAVMVADVNSVRDLVEMSAAAKGVLQSPASPIVLAKRRADANLAPSVAPHNHRLGIMLPYTPLQHLLFATGLLGPLVMTSANQSDEPLVIDNAEALERLGVICDAFLWHDRPIQRPIDDSICIDMGETETLPIRRARGYVPASIKLPIHSSTPGLCVGGELKNTVAVVREDEVVLSQHLGNLTHPLSYQYFERAIEDLCQLFEVAPRWIAHDLHPSYLSTLYAKELADKWGVPLIPVQHHHAHAASLLAEHQEKGPALAVVCDGVGYGRDGGIWGGELMLLNDLGTCERLASLKPMRLVGGDAAARDTRRCAAGLLFETVGEKFHQLPAFLRLGFSSEEEQVVPHMLRKNFNCPLSSAAGRVFDGVAALLGVCDRNEFEAQAAMALEAIAAGGEEVREELFEIVEGGDVKRIDLGRLVRWLVKEVEGGRNVGKLSGVFHDQFARAWDAVVGETAEQTGIRVVGLSGGVFCNERLTRRLTELLELRGLRVLRHRVVPPGDGGIALGQAAVAAESGAGEQ